MQAADILGIQEHVDRLLALQKKGDSLNNQSEEVLLLKSFIVRKIYRGMLEVRQACNKIDLELAYTYDVMQKEQRRERAIFQLFNLANFAQLSTFYTLEPFFRIHNYFVTSAICTTTSGALGTTITTFSKLYGAVAKANHVAPPRALAHLIDGNPVDTSGMPPLVTKFLDSQALDSDKSRREELFAMWKTRYRIDASKKENLCGIADKKKASIGLLNSRILLLWSLHTYVQDFDSELLSLLKLVKTPVAENSNFSKVSSAGNSASVNEVARLLKIQPQVEELISLKRSNTESKRRDELELYVLETTLEGNLDIQVASNKVDQELNYNYHVILAQLLASRAKWLQYNYNLNFLQSGIMGTTAGVLYLKHFTYAGDRQFVISGGIGTGLTTLAMLQMHGFWRKVDTGPNSLAEVLNLHPDTEYRFSPFVSSFLNSPDPASADGKTRRESLNEAWKKFRVTTTNLDRTKNLKALADMPSHKYDTIKIVTNRITLLHSLKKELESFQAEVLELLRTTTSEEVADSTNLQPNYIKVTAATEATKLLGIEEQVQKFINLKKSGKLHEFDQEALKLQLSILRRIMIAGLELRTTSAKFDREITIEEQALDQLTRERDFAVALTTNANFLQLNILSMIIDGPLEETHNSERVLNGNRLNIVSGLMVGGLAFITLLEQRGGIRHATTAEPNLLGQTLGLNPPSDERLPPLLWAYLNSVSPTSERGLTRREQLIEYWQTAKVLPLNIKKPSTIEKVSVLGPHHHWWSESMKLISTRVTMLFDLRAMSDLLNSELVDLLQTLD